MALTERQQMKVMRARDLNTRPFVSVVVPCYNYGRYLATAVTSALDQDRVDVEVIIVDDASSDGSAAIALQLAEHDSRVRVIEHESNQGHICTFNDGLAEAKGDYVVLLSADDALAPGALARATALMEHRSDVVLVYGYAADFNDALPEAKTRVRNWTVWQGSRWVARMYSRGSNLIVSPEAMLRTRVMRELGGYRADMPQTSDQDVWMRASRYGKIGRVNGPDQAFYRQHGRNMHIIDFPGIVTEFRARLRTFEDFAQTEGWSPAGLRMTARRVMSRRAVRYAMTAARQEGSTGGSSTEELLEFAREAWPDIVHTLNWRRLARRPMRTPRLVARLEAFIERVRGAIEWRRWRRFGT